MQLKQPTIELRTAKADDEHLLLQIYASTRSEEMAMVPWTSDQQQAFVSMQFKAQQEHYHQKYPTASHDIIVVNRRDVGRLYVARLEDQIRIVDITLLPECRSEGVGKQILTRLMNEAADTRLPLRIYVESFNRSLKLFERLGFSRVSEDGMHLLMEWRPHTARPHDSNQG